MKLFFNSCLAMLFIAVLSISNSLAQGGQVIPFQGTLYQSGTAVNGTVNITFTIADPAWTETHENVSVTQGVYAVVLGETTPFPEDMFTTGVTPQVVVNIGGTDVAIVDLHAPYISEAIVGQNMPGQLERTFDEDGTEFNGLTMVVDGVGNAQTSAFEGVAQSTSQNTGVEGFAISGAGNAETQNGLYGQAAGDGEGNHRGVMGYGSGGGKYNHGLKGYAAGGGNGDTGQGYGEGSVNFGVEGNATGNAFNNTGVEGSNFGTEGVWNFGVHGISNAGTGTSVENTGIAGRAYGSGKNVGVYGTAANGDENWAGVFDGDVNVNGELMVNGQPINTGGGGNSSGVFDSIQVQNANDEVRAKLTSNDNGGLELYDRLGEKTFELMSNDTASHFFMYNERIRSSNGNRYPAFWMKNYDWGTYWQQIGIPTDDVDWEERLGAAYQQVWGNGGSYTIETGNNKRKVRLLAEEEYGQINVNSQDNNKLFQTGGKFWEGRPDLGYIAVYGNPDTLDVVTIQAMEVDGGANEIGQITLNGTDGSTFEFTSRGFNGSVNTTGNFLSRNSTNNTAGWFGQFNDKGFMQLVDYNDAGTDGEGAILTGFWAGHPELYMELGNGYHQVDMGIQDSVGYLWLKGKDTQNIEMGSKNWEDQGKNLPFFKMVGNDDGQDLLWMEVQRSAEGEEYGYLSLNGTDGHVATYGAREFELRNDSGNGAGVRMGINHDTNGDDPAGYAAAMSLTGTNGDNIQLGAKTWETNGHDLPFLTMRGSADVDDGGGNFYRPDLVWLEAQRWGDGTELGALTFRGTDGSEFSINSHGFSGSFPNAVYGNNGHDYVNIGSKDWEGNNGDQRGFIHLSGTSDGLPSGDTQRIYLDVDDYGNGSFGVLGLKNYQDDGGGHGLTTISLNGENGDGSFQGEVFANSFGSPRAQLQSDWGNDGQGALILKDATDTWMVQASVNDDGSSNYNGTITAFNSQDGFLTEMGGDGYISIHDSGIGEDLINLNRDGNIFAKNDISTQRTSIHSGWGNDGQGALHLRDANDNDQIRATVDDDGSGNYWGNLELTTNQGNDSRMTISSGGINMGNNAYDNGIVMNYDNSGGGVFEMYAGSTLQAFINGSNGDASFQGNVYANSLENSSGTVTSDARFKKNVKSIDNALAKTQQLNGYTYNWNKLAEKQKGIKNKEEQVGVLAQELEAVFPQLVKTDDEGYKSVNYAALTAVLIEAVKELSEQVSTLQGENAELKAELTKVDELEIKIDLIQKLLAKQTIAASQATVSR
ncbi:MAG: tail fiber domain-containing protein [Reichenbachiella sp.]|uniref:tail fiber domain-containing protein n=1 Tax=Reichenbachiella sp. TaxID=2184521 RepID=UPI002966DFDD|nr:tail fiber domain-containing protein [Reichenbachiella sp.]MDW3209909.1 tail fiber domain-containing protein [Reichenbachiella sp.]